MKRSLRILFVFLALIASSLSSSAVTHAAFAENASQHEEREAFARSFADRVLAILQDTKKSFGDRKTILRQAFSNSVDIDWIARFVLGKHWNAATPQQQERYSHLYRKFLTETYVANFAENPDKRIADIKIFSVNDEQDNDFTVRTEMRLANRENLQVTYLVQDNNAKYKVRDIAIENVSLIATHRAEFTELAARKGIEGVIARLEQVTGSGNLTLTQN